MRAIAKLVAIGLFAVTPGAASAQVNCLDRFDEYMKGLMSVLRAVQPLTSSNNRAQRCLGLERALRGHQELASKFETEPAECRAEELGKKIAETLKDIVRQDEEELRKLRCGSRR